MLNPDALDALKNGQRQIDQDGVDVAVSRQALDELIAAYEATHHPVLAVPMDPKANDAEANTVGEYLIKLLETVWDGGESFSGKRPFGNSGWEYELYIPLVKAGFVDGDLDEDGDVNNINTAKADALIFEAIASLNR